MHISKLCQSELSLSLQRVTSPPGLPLLSHTAVHFRRDKQTRAPAMYKKKRERQRQAKEREKKTLQETLEFLLPDAEIIVAENHFAYIKVMKAQ